MRSVVALTIVSSRWISALVLWYFVGEADDDVLADLLGQNQLDVVALWIANLWNTLFQVDDLSDNFGNVDALL